MLVCEICGKHVGKEKADAADHAEETGHRVFRPQYLDGVVADQPHHPPDAEAPSAESE